MQVNTAEFFGNYDWTGLPKENLWKIEVCETPKKSGEVLGKLKRLKDRYKTIRNLWVREEEESENWYEIER